jgi:hypothetical protein
VCSWTNWWWPSRRFCGLTLSVAYGSAAPRKRVRLDYRADRQRPTGAAASVVVRLSEKGWRFFAGQADWVA